MNLILFNKLKPLREKLSPFECGFDPSQLTRNPISLKFYLIAVIFLIFDIEIALVIPSPLIINTSYFSRFSVVLNLFLLILLLGLIYEWQEGALNWLNWGCS